MTFGLVESAESKTEIALHLASKADLGAIIDDMYERSRTFVRSVYFQAEAGTILSIAGGRTSDVCSGRAGGAGDFRHRA
jgi:hypothetical protein